MTSNTLSAIFVFCSKKYHGGWQHSMAGKFTKKLIYKKVQKKTTKSTKKN